MTVPWDAVGAVATVVGVGIAVWAVRQTRRAHEREKAALALAEATTLAATEWVLHASLSPRTGLIWDFPPDPPILLYVSGANVWLHEVALTWGYASERDWVLENGACGPIEEEVALPTQVYAGDRKLRLSWPGHMPERQEQLRVKLRACCSLTKEGSKHWRDVRVSSVSWQG